MLTTSASPFRSAGNASELEVSEEPVLVETYASLASLIFNDSHLGYSKERGGVSF